MSRSVKRPLFGAIACLLALIPVAIAAYSIGPTRELDSSLLLHLFHETGTPVSDVCEVIVLVGELPVVIVLLGALVWFGLALGRRRETLAGAAVVIGAGISTQVLKHVFAHTRFTEAFWTHPQELAFPSGHTTAAASLSIALVLIVPPLHRLTAATVGVLVTAAVGISVVLIGWHYPSDVLGGLLVASAWGLGAVAALRFYSDRKDAVSRHERDRPRPVAVPTE